MHQFTLPISNIDSYNIDDYIISSSNESIYHKVKNWKNNWGHDPYKFSIILEGSKSSGKTYIAKIWQNFSDAYFIDKDFSFSSEIIQTHEAFIIEDIDTSFEEELLHLFNIINENKKYLLLTKSNGSLALKLPDLASRINSLFKIQIKEPDDELMKILLFKQFSTNSLKVHDQVIEYLLKHLPRKFDEIIDIVIRINKLALEHKRNVTVPFIKNFLENNLCSYDKNM